MSKAKVEGKPECQNILIAFPHSSEEQTSLAFFKLCVATIPLLCTFCKTPPTFLVVPQVATGNEKRALDSSAATGPQFLSRRWVLLGSKAGLVSRLRTVAAIVPLGKHTTVKQKKEPH